MTHPSMFLSCARADRALAGEMVKAFRAFGWEVGWFDDEEIGAGWVDEFERRKAVFDAIIVLWTPMSRDSRFVRDEARAALERDILVNVTVGVDQVPFPFDRLNCVPLDGWSGQPGHLGWARLVSALKNMVGALAAAEETSDEAPQAGIADAPMEAALVGAASEPRDRLISEGSPHDVFISYSSKDNATALAVCAVLEGRRLRCWIAPRDIAPGESWGPAIVRGIAGAKVFVLVLSANSNLSVPVAREVERAMNRGLSILPFRIEDVQPSAELEFFVSATHWLDALTPPLERHADALADAIEGLIRRGAVRMARPG